VQHNRQHPGHPPVPEHLALVANRAAEDGRSRADKEDRQANHGAVSKNNPRDSNPVRHFSNRGLQVATSKDNRDREDKVATSKDNRDREDKVATSSVNKDKVATSSVNKDKEDKVATCNVHKDNRGRADQVATSSVHKDSKVAKDSSSNCCLSRRAALSEEQ